MASGPQPQRRLGTQRALATWKRMAQTILLMLGDRATADGGRSTGQEEQRAGAESSIVFNVLVQGPEEGERCANQPGSGQATGPIQSSCQVQQGTFRVQPSIGRSALPSEQQGNLVDMRGLRFRDGSAPRKTRHLRQPHPFKWTRRRRR